MRVLHATAGTWLERTQAWLYRQIVALPANVESHVVCTATEHLDEFPFPRVHALAEQGAPARRFPAARAPVRMRSMGGTGGEAPGERLAIEPGRVQRTGNMPTHTCRWLVRPMRR